MSAKPRSAQKPEALSPDAADDLLDMDQAIAALKTTRPTFYRWLRSGKLEGMKVGRQWRFHKNSIDRFLHGEQPLVASAADVTPIITQLRARLRQYKPVAPEFADTEGLDNVITAVNLVLLLGVNMRGTDVHLAAYSKDGQPSGNLSIRADGVVHSVLDFENRLLRPLVDRLKIMANCNLHERNLPQDGRIEIKTKTRTFDLRVCVLPTALGEAVTIRFLSPDTCNFDLSKLGYSPNDLHRLESALNRPWGLVAITGPANAGTTTALYSCLTHLTSPERKLITIEDPVEYLLPGVQQVPVRPQAGMTFAPLLRAVLRCAPNVILVGAIPDCDTLDLAQHAALTGHLVLTALHADEAVTALQRMVEIGADPFRTGEAVKLIAAQRLVRKLCPNCAQKKDLPKDRLAEVAELAARCGLKADEMPRVEYSGKGCAECNHTGFRGQLLVAETLSITPELLAAVRRQAHADELRGLAISQGMTTLVGDGLRKAAQGLTTITEVLRLTK